MMARLSNAAFLAVVANTPLIAIDLIVPDGQGRFLLGHRVNKPAQDSWFVPGGRVRKNESLDDAFARLAREELGVTGLARGEADLLGVYEHFYDDNFSGEAGVSTHYIVLGYRLRRALAVPHPPHDQHTGYRWASADDILLDDTVHDYSRAYFVSESIAA